MQSFKSFMGSYSLNIQWLTPQSAILGLISQKETFLVLNHLLFLFKFYTYNSRSSGLLNIEYLKTILYILLLKLYC